MAVEVDAGERSALLCCSNSCRTDEDGGPLIRERCSADGKLSTGSVSNRVSPACVEFSVLTGHLGRDGS